jgi:hypothetical protein
MSTFFITPLRKLCTAVERTARLSGSAQDVIVPVASLIRVTGPWSFCVHCAVLPFPICLLERMTGEDLYFAWFNRDRTVSINAFVGIRGPFDRHGGRKLFSQFLHGQLHLYGVRTSF